MTTHQFPSFRYLKQVIGIEQVLTAYDLRKGLRKSAHRLYGPCPLHGGDNPTAFRVDLRRNLWRCFTHCGGGDIIELVRRLEGCSYGEVAQQLRNIGAAPSPLHQPAYAPDIVDSDLEFRPFERNIDLDPRLPFLQEQKGISIRTAKEFEAGYAPSSPFLRDTVAVRLHDLEGRPLGYCGRRLNKKVIERWGKWKFMKGFPKSQVLYGTHRAKPYRHMGIVVVECPWAAIRLTQAGIPGNVALLGTRMSETQARWLAQSRRVLLMLDGDLAGRRGALDIAASLCASTTVHVHELPLGLEPEDFTDGMLRIFVQRYFTPL